MSDAVKFNLAVAEFNRVAELAIKYSERTYDRFINYRAWFLAFRALENTAHADPDKIAWALGQVGTKLVKDRKTGRMKKGRRVYDSDVTGFNMDSFAARIVNARRKNRGEKPIWGKLLFDAVKKLRAAAPKSANFIRSGWIWAMQAIKPSVKEGVRNVERVTFRKGNPKGFSEPAQPTINGMVTATIGSTSLLAESAPRTGSRRGNPRPVALAGLTIAYERETFEMLDHLAEKLGPEFAKVSAK